jgi:hypothetical protein
MLIDARELMKIAMGQMLSFHAAQGGCSTMTETQETKLVTYGVFMVTKRKDGREFLTRIGYAVKNGQRLEVRLDAFPVDGKFFIGEEDKKTGGSNPS